jgi:hypothetical protein
MDWFRRGRKNFYKKQKPFKRRGFENVIFERYSAICVIQYAQGIL